MKEYKKHIYDVDLRQNYFELCRLLDENILTTKISKEEYISRIKISIEVYCQIKTIPLDFSKFPKENYSPYILVFYDEPSYLSHLGFMLIWFDPIKIPLLLDHHKKNYKGEGDFTASVEFIVYDFVRDNSPMENAVRQKEIRGWVQKQRELKKDEIPEWIKNKINSLIPSEPAIENIDFNDKGNKIDKDPLPIVVNIDFNGKENKFNKVSLPIVVKYFMQLAKNKSANGKPFLTNEEVMQFVDKAFCENTDTKKVTINAKHGEQFMIWKLFYNFFNDCTLNSEYENKKQGNKGKYVSLLTNNIANWEYKQVFANFSKSDVKYWIILKDIT